MFTNEKPQERDSIAICPECKAKNIVPAPEKQDPNNLKRIPLLITFDCFKCKRRVGVPLTTLEPLTEQASGVKD